MSEKSPTTFNFAITRKKARGILGKRLILWIRVSCQSRPGAGHLRCGASITAWGRALPVAWEVAAVNHLCRDGNFRSLLPVIPSEAGASVPIATTPCHSNAPGGLFRSAPSVVIDEVGLLRGWKTALVDPCAGGRNFRQQLSIMTWEAGTSGTNTQKLSITLCEAGASGANCQSVCAGTVLPVRAVHQHPGGGSFLPPLSITRSLTPQPLRTWTRSPVGQGDGS